MKLLKNEDEQNLKILNEVLIAKRKSPFVMPPEGSAVIVLFSGGIDSVSLVSLLIEKYNYKVYPLYYKLNIINTNQYKAIDYFDKYFLKRYPNNFIPVKKRNLYNIFSFRDTSSFQEKVWKNIHLVSESVSYYPATGNYQMFFPNNPTRLGHYSFGAYDYYLELKYKYGINAYTALVAMTASDLLMRECNESTLRAINIAVCSVTGDYTFQFTAPIEKLSSFSYTKKQLAFLAKKYGVPLEHSWSCVFRAKYHCGKCQSCQERKFLFKDLYLTDTTRYINKDILPLQTRIFRKLSKWGIIKTQDNEYMEYSADQVDMNGHYQFERDIEFVKNKNGYLVRVNKTDMYCMFYSKEEIQIFEVLIRYIDTKAFSIEEVFKTHGLIIQKNKIGEFLRIALTAKLLKIKKE